MKYIEDCNGSLHVNQKTYLIISEVVLSAVISMIDAIICGANLAKHLVCYYPSDKIVLTSVKF